MLVELSWDNSEKSIIRYKFNRGWGWGDIGQAMQNASEMIVAEEHHVDVLMDFREASMLPQGALGYTQRYFNNPKPDNLGITVILGKNMFLKAMFEMASKVWGNKENPWELIFVKTEEEAYSNIKKFNTKNEAQGQPSESKT